MSKTKKIVLAVVALAIVALLAFAAFNGGHLATAACVDCGGAGLVEEAACETCSGVGQVTASWWALVPPVIAIGLALITKEVYSSLFIGIVAGAILGSDFKFTGTMDLITGTGLIDSVSGTAGIFIFLVVLGVIVALINKSGGSAAFGTWAEKHIKSRVGAMLATFVLGVLIFIDDYFNCLTVGSVMRPVTDSKKVSRAKLSYLIDATAAPICMIAPISSWAAAVASYAPEGQGLLLFVRAIPYNFYSLLTLVFIVVISLMKFDYGPMRIHEVNAKLKGDLYTSGDKAEVADEGHSEKGKVIDIILPILVLIGTCIFALAYNGGIYNGVGFAGAFSKAQSVDGSFFDSIVAFAVALFGKGGMLNIGNIINAFSNTDATVGLPWGSLIALVFAIAYFCIRKVVTFKEAMEAIPKGFIAMVPAILILTFATALKNMTGVLGAKPFVNEVMSNVPDGFASFIPAIVFLVACFISFATGTSWGTFGILIPIVMTIFDAGDPLQIIAMSACLAGSVCGDHCSPISDTTIMSSAGGQCNHLNHVSTQLPYAISVAGISLVMYILAGFVQSAFIVLPVGVFVTVGFLLVMRLIMMKKYGKENI